MECVGEDKRDIGVEEDNIDRAGRRRGLRKQKKQRNRMGDEQEKVVAGMCEEKRRREYIFVP